MSVASVFTALADQVRRITGGSAALSVEAMTQALSGVTLGSGVDPSGATAEPSQLLSGQKFIGAAGLLQDGAMVNQGAVIASLDATNKSYTIPAGYHDGSGKVSVTTQTKTVTPSSAQQTVYPDSGKLLSAVTVAAQIGKMVYSGTFTGNGTISFNVGVTLDSTDIVIFCATQAMNTTGTDNFTQYGYRAQADDNKAVATTGEEAGVSFYNNSVQVISFHFDPSITYIWYLIKA